MNEPLHQAALRIRERGIFLGGTIGTFESHGREQFVRLLRHGLNPQSRLLDLGCGCLRGGYWTIRFLDPDRYFGIEPNREMLEAGKTEIAGVDLIEARRPRFDTNDRYDFSVFGIEHFDYVMAGSIWTHAPLCDIALMMEQFRRHSHPGSVFLGSFVRTREAGYQGDTWIGKSHQSDRAGLVSHNFDTLASMASDLGLALTHLEPNKIGSISWLRMTRAENQ